MSINHISVWVLCCRSGIINGGFFFVVVESSRRRASPTVRVSQQAWGGETLAWVSRALSASWSPRPSRCFHLSARTFRRPPGLLLLTESHPPSTGGTRLPSSSSTMRNPRPRLVAGCHPAGESALSEGGDSARSLPSGTSLPETRPRLPEQTRTAGGEPELDFRSRLLEPSDPQALPTVLWETVLPVSLNPSAGEVHSLLTELLVSWTRWTASSQRLHRLLDRSKVFWNLTVFTPWLTVSKLQ